MTSVLLGEIKDALTIKKLLLEVKLGSELKEKLEKIADTWLEASVP